MKLGIAKALEHKSPDEWAKKHAALGLKAVCFPLEAGEPKSLIDDYARACRDYGLTVAEAGAWCNLLDESNAKRNFDYAVRTCELAERVGAKCVVNISGSLNKNQWDGGCGENFSRETFDRVVEITRSIIEKSGIRNTKYTLEPMPWAVPYSADGYLDLIKAVNSGNFGVHMDAVNLICSPERLFFQRGFMDDLFEKTDQHIVSAHLKDFKLGGSLVFNVSEAPLLTGDFDVLYYLRKLQAADEDIPVIIEHLRTDAEYIEAVNRLKDAVSGTDIKFA